MAATINWQILIVIVVPLAFGLAAIKAASRFRRRRTQIAARFIGAAFILAFLVVAVEFSPYQLISTMWAYHLQPKWEAANPQTKAQLEACLSLYSKREIQPSQSAWAQGLYPELGPGERMLRYRLLYRAPLDVVYRSNDTIAVILTSYE